MEPQTMFIGGKWTEGSEKKIGLELGGKSPNIIFADADIDAAVEWAMIGIFFNQGEVCAAGSRIIIEESAHDEFVRRLKEKAERMTIGNPLENPDIGPVITQKDMEKVLSYIKSGIDEGALADTQKGLVADFEIQEAE